MPDLPAGIEIQPLSPERWPGLEQLFGPSGATDGCWCMWFRLTSKEYGVGRGESNRRAFEAIVASGAVPGLLAYVDGEPAGWCAIQPREAYPRLNRSRLTKPVDATAAWAVTCFFTKREHRNRGLGLALLRAAVEHAAAHGAEVIEGFPIDPADGGRIDPGAGFHGFVSTFRQAGFEEVMRRNETRPIMRFIVPR